MTTNETPYRPQVGDRVKLLPGGASDTFAKPPLIDGNEYTVEEAYYSHVRLNGPYSYVGVDMVQLISRADGVPVENAPESGGSRAILAIRRLSSGMGTPAVMSRVSIEMGLVELALERIGQRRELQKENDELRKELAEAAILIQVIRNTENISYSGTVSAIDAFLARHQPPSAANTPQE